MDSQESQFSGFLNLLSSQIPTTENPTQLLSFSPNPDHGGAASRAQSGEDRKQRCKWSTAEDLVLISAWLNTSKDPVVGNEQRAGTFWKRIASYYHASPKVIGLPKREQSHCKQRWGKINEGVCKFVGSYDAATKQRTSGQSEDDVLKAAHGIFFNDYKVKFSLEHAWRELRNDQKWCGTYGSSQQSSGTKRKRVGEDQSFQSSASMPSVNGEDEPMARPIGVKAAKAKAKRSVGEERKKLEEFQEMWEIKARDIALKDKLSKSKMLESLLARTEPLSELEVALKNKLISDMLM
ncbi:hypothetical protein N665_0168s0005 [Sinapis alba]|nr:hypothetical protein N665_7275s0002 [Sinapis alba]KAF8080631.1 hypothetical protein N665_0932s0031 [Sinapis alba]KAF8104762.1 hypothetical protein N665_0168s0005 [Sinapis alba]